jgi:glycosyltransferase involved in cell wall biosynthesis
VKFAGDVSDTELMQYYGRAKALLFPGVEDFGIVPLEAAAAGCPVIALAHGGVLDSMTSSTAVLYKNAGHIGLQQAIQEFEQNAQRFDEHCLRIHAKAFSEENFMARFNQIVERLIQRTFND